MGALRRPGNPGPDRQAGSVDRRRRFARCIRVAEGAVESRPPVIRHCGEEQLQYGIPSSDGRHRTRLVSAPLSMRHCTALPTILSQLSPCLSASGWGPFAPLSESSQLLATVLAVQSTSNPCSAREPIAGQASLAMT